MIANQYQLPAGREARTQDELWAQVQACCQGGCKDILDTSYRLASETHQGAWRRLPEGAPTTPYIIHPLRVACIAAREWGLVDARTLATCLLHDTLEDCPPDRKIDLADEIVRSVGDDVALAVEALSKPRLPEPCPIETRAARDARYFALLRAAPEWVRLIKCADRVDNLRDARLLGDLGFWQRYSSETIGWHLYLARETAAIAEVALFHALVEGERALRGRVPVWADGHMVDPVAAARVPGQIARYHQVVGLALRGETLILGMVHPKDRKALRAVQEVSGLQILVEAISQPAFDDVIAAGRYGGADDRNE